jgi:hypothetical protein
MSLQGLPDFHQPIQTGEGTIYYPYEGMGSHALTPTRLEVARQEDGRPDFYLTLVHGPDPTLPPEPHGVLDFRLRAQYAVESALGAARKPYPSATVAPCAFTGGWFRLYPAGVIEEQIPADLLRPARLAWNGLGIARCSLKISQDGASLLEKALQREQLLFQAKVELEIEGVSPRMPLRVTFNPAEMWRALKLMSDEAGGLLREDLVKKLRENSFPVKLEISGDARSLDRAEFAEVMADRIRMRFGAFASAPAFEAAGYFVLVGDAPGEGSFLWDLSEPSRAQRPLALFLHPLEAAQQLVRAAGIDAVRKKVKTPQLQTGVHQITIAANLPAQPEGIYALGVTLTAPPKKPFRPQAQVQTIELQPPGFTGSAQLRLSPKEPLEYQYQAFAVQEMNGQVRKLDGESCSWQEDRLLLSGDDFPVRMIALELSPSLSRLTSSITARLSWMMPDAQGPVERAFALGPTGLTLAVPKGCEEARLSFEIVSLDGGKTLRAGPMPARDLNLDLSAFPEYGPHTVEIECEFPERINLLALELLPEGGLEKEITVLAFTPANAKKRWSWFAQSPFQPGYRYRKRTQTESAPNPWSEIQGPFEALRIKAD